MRNRVHEHPLLGRNKGDSGNGVGGFLVADKLGVGVCVIPEEEGVVDCGPGVVDAREQADLGRNRAFVEIRENLVRNGIRRGL